MATDRRAFFKFLSAGVAGIALEQAIPLGRVWSFPKKIVIAPHILELPRWGWNEPIYLHPAQLKALKEMGYGIPYYAEIPDTVGTYMGISRTEYTFGGLPLYADPTMPPDRIELRPPRRKSSWQLAR